MNRPEEASPNERGVTTKTKTPITSEAEMVMNIKLNAKAPKHIAKNVCKKLGSRSESFGLYIRWT